MWKSLCGAFEGVWCYWHTVHESAKKTARGFCNAIQWKVGTSRRVLDLVVCVCVCVCVTRSAYTCAMSIFLYLENYAIYFGDQMMYTIVHNSTSFKYCYNRYEIISVIITIINVSWKYNHYLEVIRNNGNDDNTPNMSSVLSMCQTLLRSSLHINFWNVVSLERCLYPWKNWELLGLRMSV